MGDGSNVYDWGGGKKEDRKKEEGEREDGEEKEKKKKAPKMKLEASGLLRDESMKNEKGSVQKYTASPDSCMPTNHWVFIPFKGEDILEKIPVHRKEWYLFGKDREVADIPTDHLTCSRQHAVIQFRKRVTSNEFGEENVKVVPYVIDLKVTKTGKTVFHLIFFFF